MSSINLLRETETALDRHDIPVSAIKYVMNKEGFIPIAEFMHAADGYWYEDRADWLGVDPSLKVVGHSWWLERRKINGREGWVFRKRPLCPTIQSPAFRPDTDRADGEELATDQLEKPE